jgi:hypothetical protein
MAKKRFDPEKIDGRTEAVREAVGAIVAASHDWSNGIEDELRALPSAERHNFVVAAGRAIGMLGDYIAESVRSAE